MKKILVILMFVLIFSFSSLKVSAKINEYSYVDFTINHTETNGKAVFFFMPRNNFANPTVLFSFNNSTENEARVSGYLAADGESYDFFIETPQSTTSIELINMPWNNILGVVYDPIANVFYFYSFNLSTGETATISVQNVKIYNSQYSVGDKISLNSSVFLWANATNYELAGTAAQINAINIQRLTQLWNYNRPIILKTIWNNGRNTGAGVDLNDYVLKDNVSGFIPPVLAAVQAFLDIRFGSVTLGAIFLIPFSITFVWFIIRQFRGGGGD